MIITVESTLSCVTGTTLEIPHDWSEVEGWYVKWDSLHYRVGDTWHEVPLDSADTNIIDWKRPISVAIENDQGELLAEAFQPNW